uniref:Protein STPG3 n=1 Tax=Pogona vitticeps TaxID=103695 RepID=A0ABM5F5F3_9SAUR
MMGHIFITRGDMSRPRTSVRILGIPPPFFSPSSNIILFFFPVSPEGGGRRSWQKSWFLCKNPFIRKTDFATETNWPSPFDYGQTLGSQLANRPTSPNFTIGQKTEFSFVNKNTINDPAPNRYDTEQAYKHILNRSPSFVISPAPHLIYRWPRKEGTPGPAAYNVERGHIARLPSTPSFFIQGVRRPKRHETGPFSAL